MCVFHVFQIVQMIPNRAQRITYVFRILQMYRHFVYTFGRVCLMKYFADVH